MRPIYAAVAATLALACIPSFACGAEAHFQKTLQATGNVSLNVCTNAGNIHVTGAGNGEITISGRVYNSKRHMFGSSDEITKIAAQPPIQQNGNSIIVGNHDTCSDSIFRNLAIDYEISIPKNSTVVANSGSGDLTIDSIAGSVHAVTGSGDVRTNGIGTDSKLETGSGTINIHGAQGTLKAQTGSGDIDLHNSRVTEVKLDTGSGSITANEVRGGLSMQTGSGDLTASGAPESDWKMSTGSGSIHFQADPNAKFTLDAESSSGSINSRLPVTMAGHFEKGVVRGPINGGGPAVRMHTGSGDIVLQ